MIAITIPITLKRRGVEAKIILEDTPMAQPQKDPPLIAMIAKAHVYLEALADGAGAGHTDVANRLGTHGPDISRILPSPSWHRRSRKLSSPAGNRPI